MIFIYFLFFFIFTSFIRLSRWIPNNQSRQYSKSNKNDSFEILLNFHIFRFSSIYVLRKIMPDIFRTSFNYWDERESARNVNINKEARLDSWKLTRQKSWKRGKPKKVEELTRQKVSKTLKGDKSARKPNDVGKSHDFDST